MTDVYKKITGTEEAPGTTGAWLKFVDIADGHAIAAILQALDIEIGAVELKDATSDNRAVVGSDGGLSTKDTGPSWSSSLGVSGARFTSADQSGSDADVTDAPSSGEKLVITDIVVSVDTDMRVDFKEETSGTVLYSLYMSANSPTQFTPRGEMKLATADKKLQVRTSAAGNISVTAFYYSEE